MIDTTGINSGPRHDVLQEMLVEAAQHTLTVPKGVPLYNKVDHSRQRVEIPASLPGRSVPALYNIDWRATTHVSAGLGSGQNCWL
jgi:hypothetical protein